MKEPQDEAQVQEATEALRAAVAFIDAHTRGLEMPGDPHSRIALGTLDLAMEYQAGALLLAQHGLFAPVYALLRCIVEATTRGMWLANCATEAEFEAFKHNNFGGKTQYSMIDEIGVKFGREAGVLREMHKQSWRVLNDFTHSGIGHVSRRTGEDFTGPNYPVAEVVQTLRVTSAMGLIAAIQLCELSGHQDVGRQLLAFAEEHKLPSA